MKIYEYDIVIIGSGVAGLYTAVEISKRKDFDGKILIVTKSPFGESNSRYAQGGISAVINRNIKDSILLHVKDTLKSGAGLCDEQVVEYIAGNAQNAINELVDIGVKFDCDKKGNFSYTLGGAHSVERVLHCGGDATGMIMVNVLCEVVKKSEKINIIEKCFSVELLLSETKECCGVVIFNNQSKEHEIVLSSKIVLATGGAGQVYKYTTNPYGATGDGVALAYEAGAIIQDMEFVQFHPTALALSPDIKNRYLISEAVRGEGAKLVNNTGKEFMSEYCEDKELAQRDVVTRAIWQEMKKENKPNVFLKTNNIGSEIILKRFPSIAKKCISKGIDITKNLIPIAPAAHYMIGGVKVNQSGQTSVKGLYAVGEAASTGFHGANRLASNSLLECFVCAQKLAQDIDLTSIKTFSKNDKFLQNYIAKYEFPLKNDNDNFKDLKNQIKDIMWEKVGIIRDEKSLLEAKNKIEKLKSDITNISVVSNLSAYEYRNMLIVSEIITKCALERKESRGAHYRSDYKEMLSIPKHSLIQKFI